MLSRDSIELFDRLDWNFHGRERIKKKTFAELLSSKSAANFAEILLLQQRVRMKMRLA